MINFFGSVIDYFETFNFSDIFFFVATLVLIILLVYILYLVRIEESDRDYDKERINTKKIKEEIKETVEKKK